MDEGQRGYAGDVAEVGIDIAVAAQVFVELYGSKQMGVAVGELLAASIEKGRGEPKALTQKQRRRQLQVVVVVVEAAAVIIILQLVVDIVCPRRYAQCSLMPGH